MTEEEVQLMMEDLKAQAKEQPEDFNAWFWFGLIEKLCGGDILKWNAVLKQNFIQCLNLLSYWNRKDQDAKRELDRTMEQQNRDRLSQI